MGGGLQCTHRLHSWWSPWTAASSLLLLVALANSTITCGPGIKSAGGTFPKGDIVLEYGSGAPLEITCVLDPENDLVRNLSRGSGGGRRRTAADNGGGGSTSWPSHRITFRKNSERLPERYVTVLNSTAALLRIPDPPAGRDTYNCMLVLLDPTAAAAAANGERRQRNVTNRAPDVAAADNDNDDHHYDDDNDNDDDDDAAAAAAAPRSQQPSSSLDAMLDSDENTLFSTMQPSSLETSGPPPLVPFDQEVGVCLNSVYVGYKPFNITNITCISKNWEVLTCNWTKPENPVKTTYKLSYKLAGRAGGRSVSTCPTDSDITRNTCYWDYSTSPLYRQMHEIFFFTLYGENALGNSTSVIRFNHYANMIPASPTNITILDKTSSSAMLRWSIGAPLAVFPRPFVNKIEYKSQWDSNLDHWHSVNISETCNSSTAFNHTNSSSSKLNCPERNSIYFYFNVTNLKYPFTHYDFRIYVRSSIARGEDKWSAPGCITLTTKSTIPRRPPRTDIGSFESVTSSVDKSVRDVFIYWQNIDDNEKCGDSFEYRVHYTSVTEKNETIVHYSNETYKNYAKFVGLSTVIGYNFIVYSANNEGLSTEHSTVYVPGESDKLNEPLSFTKMAFDEQGIFELSWKNASNHKTTSPAANQLNDYTIFWCESDKDRPYQCNGYMNWIHIPSSESCYNVTVSDHTKIYQFAISANSKSLTTRNDFRGPYYRPAATTSSSGMVWASCTVLHNKIVGKIKNIWVNIIESTYMELRWKLDCSDRIGAVLGFKIIYCPVVSINNSACKEPMLNKTVSGEMGQDSQGLAVITDLKSYTTYMVKIALITKHGVGLYSDPLLNTTMEGPPDMQDVKLSVAGFTNTSVSLRWTPPKFPNGVVRYYFVHYHLNVSQQQRDLIDSLDEQQPSVEKNLVKIYDTKCRLDNLESYRNYTISVSACTTKCSNHTIPVQVRTAVGLPGRVAQPNLMYENTTRILVSWPKPSKPAGPVDYYQLIFAHHSGPTNSPQATNGNSGGGPSSSSSSSSSPSSAALASSAQLEDPDNYVYHSVSNEYRVPVPDCNSERDKGQQTFSFIVRAVNNNPSDPDKPFYGPWSVPGSVSCLLPGLPLLLHILIWSCLLIVLSTVSTYWGNRIWKKYKVMSNVEIILPPALNVHFKFDHFNDFEDNGEPESEQSYYEENDHVVYVSATEDGGGVIMYDDADSNVTPPAESNGQNNCETADNGSDDGVPPQQPRRIPVTTAIATADGDNESSSSKRQLIVTSKKGDDDDGSVKDCEIKEAVAEPVPAIVPVLPFFTLPDTPPPLTVKPLTTSTSAVTTAATLTNGSGVARANNGVSSFVRANGGSSSSFVRANNGVSSFVRANGGGSVVARNSGCHKDGGGGGRAARNSGYQDGSMVVVMNSLYNGGGGCIVTTTAATTVGGGCIVTTLAATAVGDDGGGGDDDDDDDQPPPQSRDKKGLLERPERRSVGGGHRENGDDDDGDGKKFPVESPSSVEHVNNDNGLLMVQQRRDKRENEPSSSKRVDHHINYNKQQQQHHHHRQHQNQLQKNNSGYCGKQMLIAAAAGASAAAAESESTQQQQQQQQQLQQQLLLQPGAGGDGVAIPVAPYVMFDRVKSQKRLLAMDIRRPELAKTAAGTNDNDDDDDDRSSSSSGGTSSVVVVQHDNDITIMETMTAAAS